ncbi:hypothetical protein [Myxococcus sp. AB036A]|uniref:hypothetical protein n=1 Tax=Myxococcus sp. AB036A TaxID=2562793 RepID=UPI001E521333|nr:hypothetical protein [Myxococcus sp. AB036A]
MNWRWCLSLAACLSVVIPAHAARASSEFERHVAEAVRLYDDLEYVLALHTGIIADLGRYQFGS